MPSKTKPDPTRVYQCRDSVTFSLEDTIRKGERRRGDDPLVTAHFEHWVEDGALIHAHPGAGTLPAPRKRQPQADAVIYEPLTVLDVVVSRRPLRVLKASTEELVQLPVATAVARDSELVRQLPDAFEVPKVKR